ncbi:MAG: DNA polymerase III subunit delta [Anaerolineae bacterium]|jgi:DNA polymerase-3 subunit delta
MGKPVPTFYVFHGSDEFTAAERVAAFREQLGSPGTADLNTTWLDGRRVTLGELRSACEALPFLADRRLIIVTGLLSRLSREDGDFLEVLLRLLPDLPETTRLVFVEKKALPSGHPVLKLARSHERGYALRFEPPRDSALPAWIIERAQRYEGEFSRRAAAYLAQIVGSDLRLLDQEIRKLATYVGPHGQISLEDVTRLVPYAQEAIIFDLVDALGHRDGKTASVTLKQLLEAGEHPMGILAMVVRQFRLLIQVKELSEAGQSATSVAPILEIHPYPARKLHRQARNFTMDQLEKIYRHLLATDAQIKTGKITPVVALDLLVAGLAEPS